MFEKTGTECHPSFPVEVKTYESNIAYTLRFMIDTRVSLAFKYCFSGMLIAEKGGGYELD